MKRRAFLACGAAAAAILFAAGAGAASIHLVDLGGVTGSAAEQDFRIAATYWGSMLTNNVTVNLGVGFGHFDDSRTIGTTFSALDAGPVGLWEFGVGLTRSNSTLDQTAVLPTLNATTGGISAILNGVGTNGFTSAAAADQIYAQGTATAEQNLLLNTALVKAIGFAAAYDPIGNPQNLDGEVTFSSDFAFDFDPTNGIADHHMDFLSVAIHEIGHALGFTSGVDNYDYSGGPDGPGSGQSDVNGSVALTALDMFRYSGDPQGLAGGPVLDETVGTASYFSIDGGQTQLFGHSLFSTGAFNGDGEQASHWKDSGGCNGLSQLGIMDPTTCYGQLGVVKALDLAAFDAIGWNVSVDALAGNGSYTRTTAQIYADLARGVPEPASWTLMLGGFGAMGAAMRRRQRAAVRFG